MKKILASLLAVVVLLAVMVTPVMAATSTEITATVPAILELDAPSAIALGEMSLGDNPSSSATVGSVACNNASGFTLKVKDEKTTGTGCMTDGTYTLSNALLITIGDLTAQDVTTERTVDTTTGPGEETYSLGVMQTVVIDDAASTGYSITLTFIATANS